MDNVNRRRREVWLPVFSVAVVTMAALAATLLPSRARQQAQVAPSRISVGVVTAPPLRSSTQAMGGSQACSNCGTVESVVAIHGRANGQLQAIGFLMNIRMDDGDVRTVEHRGALAAGSRVVVEGDAVRALRAGI